MKKLTALEAEMFTLLLERVTQHPTFRSKPLGAPGSIARQMQEDRIAWENRARIVIARVQGPEECLSLAKLFGAAPAMLAALKAANLTFLPDYMGGTTDREGRERVHKQMAEAIAMAEGRS